jgi:protein TonB
MFESTLVASRRQPAPRQRLLALPIAVLAHFVALSGFVLAQLVTTSPVPEPPLFVSFHPTPPPPRPVGQTTPSKAPARRPAQSPSEGQPRAAVRQITEMPTESAQPAASQTGPETGMEGIDIGGTGIEFGEIEDDWGLGNGDDVLEPVDAAPIFLRPDMEAPVLVHRVDPNYPDVAIKTKVQGVVILEAIIDTSGQVVDGRVLRDIGMGCGQAALQAVRQWRYRPATLNGRAVSVYLTVTVRFELN